MDVVNPTMYNPHRTSVEIVSRHRGNRGDTLLFLDVYSPGAELERQVVDASGTQSVRESRRQRWPWVTLGKRNSIYCCLWNAYHLSGTMLALSHTVPNSCNNCWAAVLARPQKRKLSERGGSLPKAILPEREELGFEPKSVNYQSWLMSFHPSQKIKWMGMRQKGK